MAWLARRRSRGRGGEIGGREGVGGTWVTKGAVQMDIGHASTGGEVQGGLPTLAPDRDILCYGGKPELGISSCCHGHKEF